MNAIVDQPQKPLILVAPQATKNKKAILDDLLFQDRSFKHSQHSPESLFQRQSQDLAPWSQSKSIPWYVGLILLLCLLLHGPASWLSSSESQKRVWEKIEIIAKPAQNLALQPAESQQTKVNLDYDFASGSLVYCNGDPVNGLDPDGRCVEWANNNNVGTRINGAAQGGLGALGAVGAYTAAGGTSMTGVGLPAGVGLAVLGTMSLDQSQAGFRTMWTGQQTPTMLNSSLQGAGATPLQASLIETGIGLGAGGASLFSSINIGFGRIAAVEAANMPIAAESVVLNTSENPTIVVGEGMQRVNAFSNEMVEQGINTRTYPAINMNRPINPNAYGSPKSLNANRSWLDYWARGKKADIIDIGPQPGRAISSPYYDMEIQNLYLWEQENKINPVIRFDPGY